MAKRDPIILLCDLHNYISFQVTPDELSRYFEKDGVEAVKVEMHRQLDLALEIGERIYNQTKRESHDPNR